MLKIRYATEALSDYEAFKKLHEHFGYAENNPKKFSERKVIIDTYKTYLKYVEDESMLFAILDGEVIGYAIMSVEDCNRCKIEEIYVKFELQRKGYGRQFVEQIKQVAKQEAFKEIELISANLTTDQIWFKLGFKHPIFTDDIFYRIKLK